MPAFSPGFFLRPRRKIHREKTRRNSVNEIKLGEIPVRKNIGKIMQNVDSLRLTPKSAKLTYYPTLRIQSRENTGKDLKISKTGMADRWVLVQRTKLYRPSRMWENLISDSLDVGLHSSNISEVRNFRTSRM